MALRGATALGIGLFLAGCATAPPRVDLAAESRAIGPYAAERRAAVQRAVGQAAERAFRAGRTAPRTVVRSVGLPEGGRLELVSLHRGEADQFVLWSQGQRGTQDFGYLFSLGGAGPDYLVFNGGLLPGAVAGEMAWHTLHMIDTGGTGRVDVLVYDAVDLDGDHRPDAGWTAWLYDRDRDGRVDDGEYLGPAGSRPIEREGDALVVRLATGTRRISTSDPDVLGGPTRLLQAMQSAAR